SFINIDAVDNNAVVEVINVQQGLCHDELIVWVFIVALWHLREYLKCIEVIISKAAAQERKHFVRGSCISLQLTQDFCIGYGLHATAFLTIGTSLVLSLPCPHAALRRLCF